VTSLGHPLKATGEEYENATYYYAGQDFKWFGYIHREKKGKGTKARDTG
jgi:hypothetical protein